MSCWEWLMHCHTVLDRCALQLIKDDTDAFIRRITVICLEVGTCMRTLLANQHA